MSQFAERIGAIGPDAQRRWGTMTAGSMLAHLNRVFEISLGEFEIADRSIPVVRTVLRWLLFHVLPWPKGKAKAPVSTLPESTGDFASERQKVLAALQRFVEAAETDPQRIGINPIVGAQTLSYWRRIHGKHIDHHLRQFGV